MTWIVLNTIFFKLKISSKKFCEYLSMKNNKVHAIGKRAKIIRDQLKGKLINDIWTFFETEEEKEAGKKTGT